VIPYQAGIHVNDNIFEYIVGSVSQVALRCMVTPLPPSGSEFSWSCSSGCIPNMKTNQIVNITELEVADGRDINCSMTVSDMEYTSHSVMLQAIGEYNISTTK